MSTPLIAVTDHPFPSLDPAMAAFKRLNPEVKQAESPSAEDILKVARDADGILVTYAKLDGDLLRQLNKCKVIRLYQNALWLSHIPWEFRERE